MIGGKRQERGNGWAGSGRAAVVFRVFGSGLSKGGFEIEKKSSKLHGILL
jgi:hypothetical protein